MQTQIGDVVIRRINRSDVIPHGWNKLQDDQFGITILRVVTPED